MPIFKADFHTHTLLSPCGDLNMTPENIINEALQNGIDIIGITDHNATRHCRLAVHYAQNRNIFVLCGAEVTTQEEAHCLAFFPNFEKLDAFQSFIEAHLPDIPNNPDYFGDQVQIDENLNIIYEEPRLLTAALKASIETIEKEVHRLTGIFIPAHIDRPIDSVISQLGFIPFDLNYEAVELSKYGNEEQILKKHPYLKNKTIVRGSDAHYLHNIGENTCNLEMPCVNFDKLIQYIFP